MAPLGLEQLQRVAEYELELARIALTHKRCPSSWKSLLHSAISPLPPAESSSRVEEAQAGDGERTVGITSGGGLENVSEHLSLVFDGFDAIKALYVEQRSSAVGRQSSSADRPIAGGRRDPHCLSTARFMQS